MTSQILDVFCWCTLCRGFRSCLVFMLSIMDGRLGVYATCIFCAVAAASVSFSGKRYTGFAANRYFSVLYLFAYGIQYLSVQIIKYPESVCVAVC